MFKSFHDLESLCQYVEDDKQAKGVGAANLDRYPIRFVLFDNFRDSYSFVEYLQGERHIHVESVDKWIDDNYPDLIITQSELASRIEEHIKQKSPNDCVIAPFSELARFYDNNNVRAFDALIRTIKAIEALPLAVSSHQRVYIPIVGLAGKMEAFSEDTQIQIWKLSSSQEDFTYRLVLTQGTDFDVKGLESQYVIVENIREWLNLWKNGKDVKPHIICKSNAIFANAVYAQPDNAFSYVMCNNEFEFLKNGLQLNFGNITPQSNDGDNWATLASFIDVSKEFNFSHFVCSYFEVDEISDYKGFIRLWFSHPRIFDRWLLTRYYVDFVHGEEYLCNVLNETGSYAGNEFVERITLKTSEMDGEMAIRRYCLEQAKANHVTLSGTVESKLSYKLTALGEKMGPYSAMKYFTGISRKEKEIAVNWLGRGSIHASSVKHFFPDLYVYAREGVGASVCPEWVDEYIKQYKAAKLSNKYTPEVEENINKINASETSFDTWYNQFSTTYTLLKDRDDIEVFYWIDGLGIDWIPLVRKIIDERKEQQIYLNEIKIARAQLPTCTDVNKKDLQRLLPDGTQLEKSGDLDSLAHRNTNKWPSILIDEVEIVRNSIENVLNTYNDKKIAIVSDHGLTYMSQLLSGNNMAGVTSDHHGRIAISDKVSSDSDNKYFRLDDGKTLCALKHESLCAKVPAGQGAHGGCTPEEVLVPIFIISNSPTETKWSAQLITNDVSGVQPRVKFVIKNVTATETPFVEYNNKRYALRLVGVETYESDDLLIDVNVKTFGLVIGDTKCEYAISIDTGVEEDDLFGGL